MRTYSFAEDGAGITQLAECQLPKLNVAGSIPVTRSIVLLAALLVIVMPLRAQPSAPVEDFWMQASGSRLEADSFGVGTLSERGLKSQLENGNRTALVPLVRLLVSLGRMREAEAWMEGRGMLIPVTRRDLGIALAWYGRFQLYSVISRGVTVPPDLEDDDYGTTLAAIVGIGWMRCSEGGWFHPDMLVGRTDLELLQGVFFPEPIHWEREWISMSSLDSLFARGIRQGISP